MSDTPNFVLWLDLETDGVEPGPQILEIGMILTDKTPAFAEIDRLNIVCHYDLRPPDVDPAAWPVIKPVVYDMHHANGLWAECADAVPGPLLAQVQVCEWLDSHGVTKTHIPFGGSGVGHYDSRVLEARMPALRKRLTYYALDIGSTRRFVEIGGGYWPVDQTDKPHRALPDIELHLAEARYFMTIVASVSPS